MSRRSRSLKCWRAWENWSSGCESIHRNSIEDTRTKLHAPQQPRRTHLLAAPTDADRGIAIAELVAAGLAGPDDSFIVLVPAKPESTSAMHADHCWDEAAGQWGAKT